MGNCCEHGDCPKCRESMRGFIEWLEQNERYAQEIPIAAVTELLGRDYEDMGIAQFQSEMKSAIEAAKQEGGE